MTESLAARVGALIEETLLSGGFVGHELVFEREISDGAAVGWLGLPEREMRGEVEIAPMVGIRDRRVTAILVETLPPTADIAHAATACVPLASIDSALPAAWVFGARRSQAAVAGELCAAVMRVGVPFMERLASSPEEVEMLANGHLQRETLLPAVLVAHGKRDEALVTIDEIASRKIPSSDTQKFYESYSQALRRRYLSE